MVIKPFWSVVGSVAFCGVTVYGAALWVNRPSAEIAKPSPTIARKPVGAERHTWRNVQIVAGGFVDGIVFHPTAKDVAYLRTDMGGAYRFEAKNREWLPINDNVGQQDWNLHGIESLALDPHDPNRVYLAAGTYTNTWAGNASMLRSSDRGETWQRTAMPFKMGGNEDGRSAGERLAVDPGKGSILFFGSRHNGLWKSADFGATWSLVDTFPITGRTNGVGIVWVVFDGRDGRPGLATRTIYVGVQQKDGPGIYVSHDKGATWEVAEGQPKGLLPHQAKFAPTGELYVTYADAPGPNGMSSGAVWKWDTTTGKWTDISPLPPKSCGFAGLSLGQKPGVVVVSTMDRWGPGDDIFRSTNGGKTWTGLKDNAVLDPSLSPFLKWGKEKPRFGWWMGAVAFDPFRPERLLFTTGATIWETNDVASADTGKPTHWAVGGKGVEQTAVVDLISPPQGAHLLSGLSDIGGFRHDDLTVSPPAGMSNNPIISSTESLDFAEKKPDVIVRSGNGGNTQHGAISIDGGTTWRPFASEPAGTKGGGPIAVSADGSTLLWSPRGATPAYSVDGGATWKTCAGLAENARPVSDRVNPKVFYGFDSSTGILLVSDDGGAHFTKCTVSFPANGGARLRAVAGHEGELYLTDNGGLFHIGQGGKTMNKVETMEQADAIGMGKGAAGKEYPALYLIGTVSGISGIFRSDDTGGTWVRINDDQHQFGAIGPVIGDPRIYGRVYVGSNGRGILYADPMPTTK